VPSPRRHPDADPRSADAAFAAVAAALWSERQTLDLLQFRLVTQRLQLSAGVVRWLARTDDEIRAVLLRLRSEEVIRAAEVDALAEVLALQPGATLDALVNAAPMRWALVLADTRDDLRSLVSEIDSGLAETRRLLSGGAAAARRSLDQLTLGVDVVPDIDQVARTVELADLTTSHLAVQLASTSVTYDAALRTTATISARSLREFLALPTL
jgi:hypothetical protein